MTTPPDLEIKQSFVLRWLPWLVSAGAMVVYLLTLNPWVSLANLPQVGRVTGWTWQPELLSPAYFLVTYPLHWLPAKWIPFGLNLFSAICAALTLGQLVRSIALLPHNSTHEQRERSDSEHALLTIRSSWIPPVMAALVCGFQLTFWEHATNGTIEMFDLLLFAWVIRALLEYRLDGRDAWLMRAALVYAVGMTNNFAMWGFLPIFVIALVWMRGVSFFNLRFLGRLIFFGLLGLSLYLLLPLIASFSKVEPINFWQAFKYNLSLQRGIIFSFPKLPTRGLENMEWLTMVAVCILPILLFSIRWPSYFGDTSRLGVAFTTFIFHLMFGLYLCVCIWTLLDAPFSPRHRGLGLPFLTFEYLAAFCIGYITGYFLLIFRDQITWGRRPPPLTRMINRFVTLLVAILVVLSPVALISKNLPQIRLTNGSMMSSFADAVGEGLPNSAVILSDDPRRLLITQAWLGKTGRLNDFIGLDTQSLKWPAYHRYLQWRYGSKWGSTVDQKREVLFEPVELIELLTSLAKRSEVWYLHPSFGYYFERFYLEPHGLAYQLRQLGTNSMLPPALDSALLQQNEAFWTKITDQCLQPILAVTKPREPNVKMDLAERALRALGIPPDQNAQAKMLGNYYSRGLNEWAVELQKAGELAKAGADFQLTRQLNPDNIVAQFNLEYNQNLRDGKNKPIDLPTSVEDQFGKARTWDQVLSENGPYDEPGFCYAQGDTYMRNGLFRQAAQCFDRVRTLLPDDAASRLWLTHLYVINRLPDKALELIAELKNNRERFNLTTNNYHQLVGLEAKAYFVRNDAAQTIKLLDSALNKSPNDEDLLRTVTSVYFETGQFSNALAVIERHLGLTPDNPGLLLNQAVIQMQIKSYDRAIDPLTRVLDLQATNATARFYRAICSLQSDQLDDAKKDYEEVEKVPPQLLIQQFRVYPFQVYYGLGEIAYRRKDTNAAIGYYQAYLTNSVPNTEEAKSVSRRLQELKGEKSPPDQSKEQKAKPEKS